MDEKPPTPLPPSLQFKRDEDFLSRYANNVHFEISSWDLKMIFGELWQEDGQAVIRQHTAITIPWIQAKVMSYFLQANIAIYEATNGRIKVPDDVMPPHPPPPPPDNPLAKKVGETLKELHDAIDGKLLTRVEAPVARWRSNTSQRLADGNSCSARRTCPLRPNSLLTENPSPFGRRGEPGRPESNVR